MDAKNKQMILKEIKTWRDSRILPTEYCDFLSNLYAEGEFHKNDENFHEKNRFYWKPSIEWKQIVVALTVSAVVLLLVLHFTWFPNWMQIGFLGVGTFLFYAMAFRLPKSIGFLRPVFLTMASLLVAVDGYYLVTKLGLLSSPEITLIVFVGVLAIWILTGIVGESRMIVAAAWLGIGVLYELALHYQRDLSFSSYGLHSVYWLVFAGVSIALAVFWGRINLFTAPVWAVLGVMATLVPDVLYLFSGQKPDFLIDVSAFLKISLITTGLIAYREGIQNWLDRFSITAYNERK